MNEIEITWTLLASAAGVTLVTERAVWIGKNLLNLQGRQVQLLALGVGVAVAVGARAALGARTWQELALSAVAGVIYGCAAIGLNGLGANLDK